MCTCVVHVGIISRPSCPSSLQAAFRDGAKDVRAADKAAALNEQAALENLQRQRDRLHKKVQMLQICLKLLMSSVIVS